MFGSDDDIDFIPGNNSKLASLFSGAKSDGDNASFTFSAPKQPKKGILKDDRKSKSEVTIKQGVTQTEDAAVGKLSIIIVRAVQVFLLVDGKYAPQGKLGAAVLGNSSRSIYQLLLYKGKQQHVTSTKITPEFVFTVQAHNYGNFYNEQGQNWSIHFDDVTDCEEFAREVALARAASQGGADKVLSLLTQDISVPNETESDNVTANEGDMVEIYYSVQTYAAGKLGMLVESNRDAKKPQRVKIVKKVWEEGLIGVSRGVKRILLLPPNLVGPWKKDAPDGTSLVVEVEIGRMRQVKLSHPSNSSRPSTPSRASSPRLPSVADSGESAFESGADDSIRARGASISQALSSSPRTNKASLISRMARMGQATLPLRGAISCNPSDSEETGDESSSRSAKGATFKPVKGRTVKARPNASHQMMSTDAKPSVPPQQVMVYQSVPVPWQQQAMMDNYNVGRTYQGTDGRSYAVPPSNTSLPVYASPSMCDSIGTPPGAAASDLSIFLSETRTHNTEVRMAVSKVGDKVDQVLGKMDLVQSRSSTTVALMDNTSLLTTIQKMITENEQLKLELDDKRNKLEVQNDKIYQLLNTKQQYMEQSTSSSSQEAVIVSLQAEKLKLTTELSALKEKANGMLLNQERSQNSWEKQIFELKDIIRKMQVDLAGKHDSKIDIDQKLNEIKNLQGSLTEMQSSKEDVIKKLTAKEEELVGVKNEALHQLANLTEKYSSQISLMETQGALIKKQLETLRAKMSEPSNESLTADKVRNVMNAVWKALQPQFISGSDYEGESIRRILMTTIRDVTNQHVNANTASPAKDVKAVVTPATEVKATAAPAKMARTPSPPPRETKTTSTPARTLSPPPKGAKNASSPPEETKTTGSPTPPPKDAKTTGAPATTVRTPSPPPKDTKTTGAPARTVRTPSPPPKDAKTTSAPARTVRTPSPPPKASSPPPKDATITAVPVKATLVESEKPKAAERKLPGSQTKPAADKIFAEVSPVKKEEGLQETGIPKTQRVVSDNKSTPVVQTSPKQTPKPSPKQSPQPPRKINGPNEIKSEKIVAGEEKPAGVVKSDAGVKLAVGGKQEAEVQKAVPAIKNEEAEGWRPQPPPLFDSEDDEDAWLA